MKIKQHLTRFLTLFLAAMLLIPTTSRWPMTAIKADESTELCKEHTEHTEDCGYKESTDEKPCTHEHDDNCGYDPETGTGCSHIHDENCGYVAANEGSPCTFVCNTDDTQTGDDTYEMDNQSVSTTTYSSDSFEIPFEGRVYLRNPLHENMPPTEQFSFSLYRKIISKNDSLNDSLNDVGYNDLINGDIKNDSHGILDLDTLSFSLIDLTEAGIDSGPFECIYTIKQNIPDDLTKSIYRYDPVEWTITIPGKVINNEGSKVLDISENQIYVYPYNYTYPGTITIDFLNQTSTFQLTAEKAIQLDINEPTKNQRKPNADEVFDFQISIYQDSLSFKYLKDPKFEPEPEKFSVINKVNNQNEKIDFGEITTYYNDSKLSELINNEEDDNFLLYKIEEIDSGDYNALLQGYYILINVRRDNYGISLNLFPYEFNAGSSFNEVITSQPSDSLVFRNYKALTHIQTEKYVNNELPEDTFTFNLYRKKIIPSQGGEPTSLNTLVSTLDELDNKDQYNDIGDFVSSTTNIGRFIKFHEIYYTENDLKDADGNEVNSVIYIYTIKEADKDGYTNDGRVLQYIVEVGRLNGIIAVKKDIKRIMLPNGDTTIIEDWSNNWAFYNSTASFHLEGEKLMWDGYDSYTINDRHYRVPEPDEQFTFHVYPYNEIIDAEEFNGDYYPEEDSNIDKSNFSTDPILSAQNQGSSIDFGSIDFTNDPRLENLQIEKPILLLYKIAEVPKDGYHVRYNNYLELYVKKSSNGSINLLYSCIKIDDSNNPDSFDYSNYGKILFENSYPHVSFKGEKYVNNVPATENEVFTFNLYRKTMSSNEDIQGDYGSLIATTQNKGKWIQFPEIRYSDKDFENGETVKRYIYTITEESKDGYRNSEIIIRYDVTLENKNNIIETTIKLKMEAVDGSFSVSLDNNIFRFNNLLSDGSAKIPAIKMVNEQPSQDYDHFQFNLEYLFRVYYDEIDFPLNQVERSEQYTLENTIGKKDENDDVLPNILFTTKPFDEVKPGEKYTYVYSMQEVHTEDSEYIQDDSLWLALVKVSNEPKYGTIAFTETYYNIPPEELPNISEKVEEGTITTYDNLIEYLNKLNNSYPPDDEYPYFNNYRSFIEINATKTVNGYEPSEDEIFDFEATPVVIINVSPQRSNTNAQHSNSMRSTVNVAQNHLGNVHFHLDYSWASNNDTVLTLLEETSQGNDIYSVDDTKYLVEVFINFDPKVPKLMNVYKVNNWSIVKLRLDEVKANEANYNEVLPYLLNKGYLTIISPDKIVFNNLKKTTSVTAEKVWKLDDGKTAADSVTVALYKDGVKYDSKTLNNDNNWQYTWENLPMANWTVEEVNPPKGFKVSITQNDYKFIITNDDIGDSVDPIDPKPDNPDKPIDPDKPDKPIDPNNPENPVVPDTVPDNPNNDSNQPSDPNYTIDENGIPTGAENPSNDLPLTGQLWWPVWILALLGFAMVTAGFHMKRRQHEQNEK